MAKDKEKAAAKVFYLKQGLSNKEIAIKVGVSENTIGKWVSTGKWEQERAARLNSSRERSEAIKEVITSLTKRRIEVFKEIEEAKQSGDNLLEAGLKKESAALSQEVAIHTKALEKMEKEYKISLSVYLEVMEAIFKDMSLYDQKLYMSSLDFQESHILNITQKLG